MLPFFKERQGVRLTTFKLKPLRTSRSYVRPLPEGDSSTLSLLWPHELPVMLKDEIAVCVTKLQGECSGILEPRQMVAGVTVAECIVRPVGDSGSGTRRVQQFAVVRRSYGTAELTVAQPCGEIRLDPHKPATRALRVPRRHFDQTGFQIDFAPVQPLKLGPA